MAPSGINDFNDTMFPSVYASHLSAMNSTSPLSSRISSELSSIFSDHDYFMKPQGADIGYHRLANSTELFESPVQGYSHADTQSRLQVDFHETTVHIEDTDFLTELGELDFGIGDLHPCSDVEMEDSFQEFIDSALEESTTSFFCEGFHGDSTPQNDGDDTLKERFFANLDLRPAQKPVNKDLAVVSPHPHLSNNGCLHDVSDLSPKCVIRHVSPYDSIPTKTCSCVEYDSASKTVYSTAHVSRHDSLRICPSSVFTGNNECLNCQTSKRVPERLMSPLFIDTSLTGCAESLPPLTDDRLQVAIDTDQLPEVDKDTTDIMKWLKDNQKSYQLDNNNNNNNFGIRKNQNEITDFTKSSCQTSCFHLDTFVDLEDFLNKVEDMHEEQSEFEQCCQRSRDHPCFNNTDMVYHSHLKLSFLEEIHERSWDDGKLILESHSDIFRKGYTQDSLTPNSSHFSHCSSPAWSPGDSAQSSPLGSMNCSSSSNWEDVPEDSSLKSQLALLNLFSEENAESLLVTDSPMPNSRFV